MLAILLFLCLSRVVQATILYQHPCLKVQPIEGKGLGTFTACDLNAGSRLYMETSILSYRNTQNRENELWTKYKKLNATDKQIVEGLHGRDLRPFSRKNLRQISDLNSFGSSRHPGGEIFPMISRINHACDANAEFHIHWTRNAGTVHTIKDIKAGEEITISYSAYENTKERRRQLKNYGFECRCRICQIPCVGHIDELTSSTINEYMNEQPPELKIEFFNTKLAMNEIMLDVSSVYKQLSVAHVEVAEFNQAREWADKHLAYEIMTRGSDDTVFQNEAISAWYWRKEVDRYEEEYSATKSKKKTKRKYKKKN